MQAFTGSTEVDVDEFLAKPVSGPPYPPLIPYHDFTLRAEVGEGDITRIVANPPSDCFDLIVIDNLVLNTARQVASIAPVPDETRRNFRFDLIRFSCDLPRTVLLQLRGTAVAVLRKENKRKTKEKRVDILIPAVVSQKCIWLLAGFWFAAYDVCNLVTGGYACRYSLFC